MSHRLNVLAAIIAFGFAQTSHAVEPAVKCESAKLKEVAKYASCRLKAEAKGVQTSTAPDFSKCEGKFTPKFESLDTKFGANVCPTEGDEASINARITSDANDVAVLLSGGSVPPPPCGNGVIDTGEDCDLEPGGLGGETCLSQGQILGGFLRCGAGCQFDYSGCNGFKRVFLTSSSHNGAFGGVAEADAICQARANFAGLPGTFKAWISAGDLIAFTDPATTFTHSTTPYVRVDGVVVATDWADLTDGTLDATINIDEFGVAHLPTFDDLAYTYTATNPDGTAVVIDAGRLGIYIPDCSDWTDNSVASTAGIGHILSTDLNWTISGADADCSPNLHLYCFEQ